MESMVTYKINNKGLVRILEASIAILIILSVLFIFFNQQKEPNNVDYSEMARDILEEVSKNNGLRNDILSDNSADLNSFVRDRVPGFLEFDIRICESLEGACGINFIEGNVYSAERVISTTIEQRSLNPKKIRLFIWEK